MPAGTPVHYDDFGYWNFEDAIPVDMIDGMFDIMTTEISFSSRRQTLLSIKYIQ